MDKIVDRSDINFDNGLPRGTDKDTHRMLGKRGNFRKSRRAERRRVSNFLIGASFPAVYLMACS